MTKEKLEYGKAEISKDSLYQSIRDIIHKARQNAYRAVNFAMVQAYWNMRNFRQFYLTFKLENNNDQIRCTLRSELSWSHYRLIMRLENPKARQGHTRLNTFQNYNGIRRIS